MTALGGESCSAYTHTVMDLLCYVPGFKATLSGSRNTCFISLEASYVPLFWSCKLKLNFPCRCHQTSDETDIVPPGRLTNSNKPESCLHVEELMYSSEQWWEHCIMWFFILCFLIKAGWGKLLKYNMTLIKFLITRWGIKQPIIICFVFNDAGNAAQGHSLLTYWFW